MNCLRLNKLINNVIIPGHVIETAAKTIKPAVLERN